MDMITSKRWAVFDREIEAWLRNSKGFKYSGGKHFVWTQNFNHARLYTREIDAKQAAKLTNNEVITLEVTAFTKETK